MVSARTVHAAVLAALLVLAVPTAAAPVDPSPSPATAPLEMLDLDDDRTSRFVSPDVDVGAALAIGHQQGTERLRRDALKHRLDRVTSVEAKQRLIFLAATRLKQRATALRADERATRRGFANGSLSGTAYLRALGVNAAMATQLERSMRTIGGFADEVQGVTVRKRILETRLIGVAGPVRLRIRDTLTGSIAGGRILVMASRNGTVLSTFDGQGRYVREAYRADRWTRDEVGDATLTSIVGLVEATYPRSYNRSTTTSFTGGLGRGIYQADLQFPAGTLQAHLDADTQGVFYEVRRSAPEPLVASEVVATETDHLRLVVNRGVPGGPLKVTTIDPETGNPVSRLVVVNGRAYRTGTDGVLWALTPTEPQFSVRATTDAGPVTLTVRPITDGSTDLGIGADEGPQPS